MPGTRTESTGKKAISDTTEKQNHHEMSPASPWSVFGVHGHRYFYSAFYSRKKNTAKDELTVGRVNANLRLT